MCAAADQRRAEQANEQVRLAGNEYLQQRDEEQNKRSQRNAHKQCLMIGPKTPYTPNERALLVRLSSLSFAVRVQVNRSAEC